MPLNKKANPTSHKRYNPPQPRPQGPVAYSVQNTDYLQKHDYPPPSPELITFGHSWHNFKCCQS
jgi:hypothetical protein